jgi:hypothetical protein
MRTHDTMNSFAEMTGGRAYYNTNDLANAVNNASNDGRAYYVLGYYASRAADKPGWRKLKVKVKRSGAQVRARAGYFTSRNAETDPEKVRKRDIREAVDSPFDFTAVPMTVRLAGQKNASDPKDIKKDVQFEVVLPANAVEIDTSDQNHMNFQLVAVARDAELKQAGSADQQVDGHLKPETLAKIKTQGLVYRYQVAVPPGEYTVKFVLRDNISGRIGSVSAPVTVQ